MFEVEHIQQVEVNEGNISDNITARGERELTSYARGRTS
jgi:hypothetical protein